MAGEGWITQDINSFGDTGRGKKVVLNAAVVPLSTPFPSYRLNFYGMIPDPLGHCTHTYKDVQSYCLTVLCPTDETSLESVTRSIRPMSLMQDLDQA